MPNLNILGSGVVAKDKPAAAKPATILGYEIRDPFAGESEFFKKRPEVGGMAAEDGKIVLNPFSPLKDSEKMLVAKNEAIRLWLRDNKVEPKFNVTPEQMKMFTNTEYGKPENEQALKHTLIARFLTGDPSAGQMTDMQKEWVNWVQSKLPKK